MKVITIVGARPQFVKAAVVSRAFSGLNGLVKEKIIHTGQHFDKNMSDIFFEDMEIPRPDYNLGVGGGSHGENTGQMLQKIEEVLENYEPRVSVTSVEVVDPSFQHMDNNSLNVTINFRLKNDPNIQSIDVLL